MKAVLSGDGANVREPCTAAATYVAAMANAIRARVTLLHVLEYPLSWYGDMAAARLSSIVDDDRLLERRQQELNSYLHDTFDALTTARRLTRGDPAGEIVSKPPRRKALP
jgi:hypothetical protein